MRCWVVIGCPRHTVARGLLGTQVIPWNRQILPHGTQLEYAYIKSATFLVAQTYHSPTWIRTLPQPNSKPTTDSELPTALKFSAFDKLCFRSFFVLYKNTFFLNVFYIISVESYILEMGSSEEKVAAVIMVGGPTKGFQFACLLYIWYAEISVVFS